MCLAKWLLEDAIRRASLLSLPKSPILRAFAFQCYCLRATFSRAQVSLLSLLAVLEFPSVDEVPFCVCHQELRPPWFHPWCHPSLVDRTLPCLECFRLPLGFSF